MSQGSEIQEENVHDALKKLYNSFDEILARLTEREQQLRTDLEDLKEREAALSASYAQEYMRRERLQEIVKLTEILHNMTSEEEICKAAARFLHKIYPNTAVRLLCASSSRTKMAVAGRSGGHGVVPETCCIAPLECLAVRMSKPVVSFTREEGIFCRLLGSCEEALGHICIPLFSEGTAFGCLSLIITQLEGSVLDSEEIEIISLFAHHVGLAVSNRRLLRFAVRESFTDQLTGLPNRRYAMEMLNREVERAARYGGNFCVVIVDIDNFKVVNDTYGHNEGDRVLILLAETARRCLRKTDIAARFGGEEFLFIFPETTLEGCLKVVERFRASFCEATMSGILKAGGITVSAGVARYPEDGRTSLALLEVADRCLYMAKANGRDRAVWSDA
ncbi:MAG: sensor domain-containing diguanylate cyclase [Bacillota bacterium]|nr:sensor domain-containing diguanylate cyclase [Bacillota bacterium]